MAEEGKNNNKGEIPSWVQRVDILLDVSPRYVTGLRSAFVRFQSPPPNAILPRAHLLLALQFLVQGRAFRWKLIVSGGLVLVDLFGAYLWIGASFLGDLLFKSSWFYGVSLKKITDELDAKLGKLCLRPITQDDIDAVLQSDPTINIERSIDIKLFDEIAKKVLKRVVLERGKRLGVFIVGGILVVHLLKGTVRKIPFIGPIVGTVVNLFMPTTVFGAAAGIAGAMHM